MIIDQGKDQFERPAALPCRQATSLVTKTRWMAALVCVALLLASVARRPWDPYDETPNAGSFGHALDIAQKVGNDDDGRRGQTIVYSKMLNGLAMFMSQAGSDGWRQTHSRNFLKELAAVIAADPHGQEQLVAALARMAKSDDPEIRAALSTFIESVLKLRDGK